MIKYIVLSLLGILLFLDSAHAQEDYSRPVNEKDPTSSFGRRFTFGGNIGMQFGAQTFIEFSPKVAYRVTDELLVGGGIKYIYIKEDWDKIYGYGGINETSIYGGSIFSNYLLFDNFFPHVEIELLNFQYYDLANNEVKRKWISSFFVGAGYRQKVGANSFVQIMLLYNLNYQTPSPYSVPYVYRIGIFL